MDADVKATFDLDMITTGLLIWTALSDGKTDDETVAAAIRLFAQLPPAVRAVAYEERKG